MAGNVTAKDASDDKTKSKAGLAPVSLTPAQCQGKDLAQGYIAAYDVGGAQQPIEKLKLTHIDGWSAYDAGGTTIRLWHELPGEEVELYRIFQADRRSILYTHSGLELIKRDAPWHRVAELADLAALPVIGQADDTCGLQRHYRGHNETQTIDVWAYADSALVTSVTVTPDHAAAGDIKKESGGHAPELSYRLTTLEGDAKTARAQIERWTNYRSTDFADIGDNESDPFLKRMIHMGFIEHPGHSH